MTAQRKRPAARRPENFERLLGKLDSAARGQGRVTVRRIHEAVGRRAFGPLLAVPALAALTPLGLIPGAPTAFALIIVLTAGQLAIGCNSIWLPRWLLDRSVEAARLRKALRVARRPTRIVDRLVGPRLQPLTGPVAERLVAAVCMAVAVAIPPLELVPFGVFAPAVGILLFALGLTARDGLLVLLALLASLGAAALVVWKLL